MTHTNIHDPLHVYSNRELPLSQLPVDNTIDTLHRALTICMENPEIPGRIQMAPFIPVEIFRQKSNTTFRGIIFVPFLPKRPKFSVSFVWITSARLLVERKWKMRRYFVNGTTQSRSCFRYQKKKQYHLTGNSHRNFRTNGKRSQSSFFKVNLAKEDLYWPLHY